MVAVPSSSTESQPSSVSNRAVLDATAGAVAGCVQRFVVAPLDVIKIRFQVQVEPIARGAATASTLPSKYTSVLQAAITIVREEGIKVWVADAHPLAHTKDYTHVAHTTAYTFHAYPHTHTHTHTHTTRDAPSPPQRACGEAPSQGNS